MKIAVLALFASLFSLNALAAKPFVVCQNDEIKLSLSEVSATEFKALVAVAGSKKTFKRITQESTGRLGAALVYQSSEIAIDLHGTVHPPYATLNVPSLGIEDEKLNCKF